MNKPSWDDLPIEAEWLAQDKDGDWYWYDGIPKPWTSMWYHVGNSDFVYRGEENHNWKSTLEKRP